MGADFLYAHFPCFILNDERRSQIRDFLNAVSDDELINLDYNWGWNAEDTLDEDYTPDSLSPKRREHLACCVRDHIFDSVVSSVNLQGSREVAHLHLTGLDYRCWITGGMSWGDGPTDAYYYFNCAGAYDPLFVLLVSFAKEDFAKKCAEDQHDEESQTADARIGFVADALADLEIGHTIVEVTTGAGEDNAVVCCFRHTDLEQLQDILGSCG